MAGFKKRNEKARELRGEMQNKARMTREELGGELLKGIRAEQLDSTVRDALTPKNRVSRLSNVGANAAAEKGVLKTENLIDKLPPRWQRLLGAEVSVDEWKLVDEAEVLDCEIKPLDVSTIKFRNETKINAFFKSRVYDDEDMMKLIVRAYTMGVEDSNTMNFGKEVSFSVVEKMKSIIKSQRKIIDFLLCDFSEKINPILHLDPKEMVERITQYFIECDLTKRFYTVPGLAFTIGFSTREELLEYVTSNSESIHAYILRRALTYIESETVTDMMYGGGLMTGHKINLATNFNYSDAGKKGGGEAAPAVVVNNNSITMNGLPPKPESIEEWQEWYAKEQAAKKIESSKESVSGPVIDLLPS